MIKIEHLYKSFGEVHVLKDISIEYRKGLCNMIIGASGSGKTVLLKTLIGLMEPDSGTVTFNGKDISGLPYEEKKRFRQHIGVLFQNSALFDFATVIENVMFPMDFFTDWSRKKKIERALYCLERVNVQGNEKKYPGELSGGMQKRVGIARAIALNPEYLICDEPTSALDVSVQAQVLNLLKTLQLERGLSMLFISHNLGVVRHIADTVGVMYRGQLVERASKENLFENPLHPYTRMLLDSVPKIGGGKRSVVPGEASDILPREGCPFAPRCANVTDKCRVGKVFLEEKNGPQGLRAVASRNVP